MALSPLDIEARRFRREFLGFSREEVGSFLSQIADALSQSNLDREELGRLLQSARAELDSFRHRESTLIEALAASERLVEDRRQQAARDAERVIDDARQQAEQLLSRTRAEATRMEQQILRLKVERENFESRLATMLDEHRRVLDLRRQEALVTDQLRGRSTVPPAVDQD